MHKFSPHKAAGLEKAERHALLQPDALLRRFGLAQGMTFADIGAGTGFFSRAAAAIVGAQGRVYAAEMSADMMSTFRNFGVPENVHLVASEEYDSKIEQAAVDLTLLAFVVHENHDVPRFVQEAMRITRPGGSVLIIDWKRQGEEHGPPEVERLDQAELLRQLGAYNIKESGELNPSHYFVHLTV